MSFTVPSRAMVKVIVHFAVWAARTPGSIVDCCQLRLILRRTASMYQPYREAKSPPPWPCTFTPGAAAPATLLVPTGRSILPPLAATALSGTGFGSSKTREGCWICLGGFSFLNSGILTSGLGGSGGFGCGWVL